ncbi:PadR family transcriptional regulator [Micromonospora wenchangensis]|uniref:PadR family transcriptional regulator n=1 Tax=Micromonospora wenchangensis TaxID=1185415 RepID=UPI00343BDE99
MQVTLTALRVLNVFLEEPTAHRYGLEIMKATGLQSGTLYPLLARFERAGWLASSKEQIDVKAEGRPARRYYFLTAEGTREARLARAEISAQLQPATGFMPGKLLPGGQY